MKHKHVTGEAFKDYYLNQVGNGMPVFVGAAGQRGHGLGNILRGLFRIATPLIKTIGSSALKKSKPIMKQVGKWALNEGINAVANAVSKGGKRSSQQNHPPPKRRRVNPSGVATKRGNNRARRRKPTVNRSKPDIFS